MNAGDPQQIFRLTEYPTRHKIVLDPVVPMPRHGSALPRPDRAQVSGD